MLRIGGRVTTRGPFFTAAGPRMIEDAIADGAEDVADYAYEQVRDRLNVVLQHPTGYYESQVRREVVGTRWQVDDSGVVYGPWLEDGKNRRQTRFKGYKTFRLVAQMVERRAGGIVDRVLSRTTRRL